ncbi:hypothetical protein [Microbacterium sp. zg.Y909]|uniref:hypothetical protein n=1 Tax=Microbacterium sp. zg.Y909 TaxID=2969413 RepID=UPI00214A95EE|nr:hypothetical protein [Microbacterium sp. zg.Y909]MCR2826212.1 hypothetical protein [Microbacterium sp. zg.Y909]
MKAHGAVGAATSVLLVLALTGCVAEPEPAPTPTATGFASEAEAFAAAEETYRAYVDALNQVDLSDPDTFEAVYAWTTGEANANERETLSEMHAEGWTVHGETKAALVEPLEFESPATVTLAVCQDVSEVDVVNAGGESQVADSRPPVQSMTVVVRESDSTATGLSISEISGRGGEPECAAD